MHGIKLLRLPTVDIQHLKGCYSKSCFRDPCKDLSGITPAHGIGLDNRKRDVVLHNLVKIGLFGLIFYKLVIFLTFDAFKYYHCAGVR